MRWAALAGVLVWLVFFAASSAVTDRLSSVDPVRLKSALDALLSTPTVAPSATPSVVAPAPTPETFPEAQLTALNLTVVGPISDDAVRRSIANRKNGIVCECLDSIDEGTSELAVRMEIANDGTMRGVHALYAEGIDRAGRDCLVRELRRTRILTTGRSGESSIAAFTLALTVPPLEEWAWVCGYERWSHASYTLTFSAPTPIPYRVTDGDPVIRGGVPPGDLTGVVRGAEGTLAACFESHGGTTVVVDFTIGNGGRVSDVLTYTRGSAELEWCVSEAVRGLRFTSQDTADVSWAFGR